jgi:hypothetical protein
MEIQARTGKMIPVKNNVFQAPVKGNKMSFTLKDKVNVVLSVVDAKTGRGIPNAQIVASQYNVVLEKGKTDQKGTFRLTVWQEEVNIRVQSKGYLEFSLKNQKITDQLKIKLVRKESIRGIVCNENQEPIPNIPVVCLGSKTGERGVLTDSKGRFEIKGFPNEKVKIIIKKEGYAPFVTETKRGLKTELKIVLTTGALVSFQIDIKTKTFKDEKIDQGHLIFIQKNPFIFVENIPCSSGLSKKIRLTPGTYDLVWVGKKQGFKIKELSIKGSEQININVEHKTSSDEFSLKELFLKCVPKEEKK